MEDIGNLIFYIVLGIIALAGSFQGKGKKKPGAPKPVQHKPGTVTTKPQAGTAAQASRPTSYTARQDRPASYTARQDRPASYTVRQERPAPKPSPWTIPSGQNMEGRYDEPMARDFSREGNIREDMAGAFTREGSIASGMGEAFAREGSIADSMAAAFASEGVSALGDSTITEFVHNEISDSEIGDAPGYDYETWHSMEIQAGEFDLKKAVIYSAVLDHKEYSR